VQTTQTILTILAGIALMTTHSTAADAQGDKSSPAGPVRLKAPQPVKPLTNYRFESSAGPIVAQTDADGTLSAWGRVASENGKTVFKPVAWPKDNPDAGVMLTQVKDGLIQVRIDGQPFTEFHWGDDEPKPFLWPVIGPTDVPVTRAYPMKHVEGERTDHVHHRSIWAAWGDIRTGNLSKLSSNYWAQTEDPKKQDRQIVKRIVRAVSGPVFGQIVAEIDWVNHTGRRDFTELRTYTFYRADDNSRMIDVRNEFSFDDRDVMFADTKEAGTLALRIATSMDEITLEKTPGNGVIRNSQGGKGSAECWGQPADWCDYTGPVENKLVGIAVFDKPSNANHPPRWHIRDYGLYAVNPYGLKDFPNGKGKNASRLFKKGEHQQFDYRILIPAGDADAARVPDQYKLYTDAPVAEIK